MTQDLLADILAGADIWIGDGGSTKAHWMAFSGGAPVAQCVTKGFNPHHHSGDEIGDRLRTVFTGFMDQGVPAPACIGYFGAGCSSARICGMMRERIVETISAVLPDRHPFVEVGSDMVLACRSVAGPVRCMMGILGTGSNTAVWDGSRITCGIPPLGYLLGDEGSGMAIGRLIMADVLRDRAPEEIEAAVCRERSRTELQEALYGAASPAAFLADTVRKAWEAKGGVAREYVDGAARRALTVFFDNIVDFYPVESYDGCLCLTGSIATMYRDIIEEMAQRRGLCVYRIVQRPLEALLK